MSDTRVVPESNDDDDKENYDPSTGHVVLIDTYDRRIRGMWIIGHLTKRGRYKIKRYKDKGSYIHAKQEMVVKPKWLANLVSSVVATVEPDTIE